MALDHLQRLLCIEAKPHAELADPEIRRRHAAIRLALSWVDVRFVIVTEQAFACAVTRENVQALNDTRSRLAEPGQSATALIARHRPATFGELVTLLGYESARAALAHGLVHIDIRQRLAPGSALVHLSVHTDAAHFLYAEPTRSAV